MSTKLSSTVDYFLPVGDDRVFLNPYIGKKISFHFTGKIHCIQCKRPTKKSFQQGHCYPCFQRLLECNLCNIHPEKCLFYEGKCHNEDWPHAHCGQSHIVYLANSSGLKVGITRSTQVPTRWIDQGAAQAIPFFKVSNRHQAGAVEVIFKQFIADKTNWQAMLKSYPPAADLVKKRDELLVLAEAQLAEIMAKYPDEVVPMPEATVTQISYPILDYPTKIKSINLDKTSLLEGQLRGIKGQYLLLDTGVISIRKFGGYEIKLFLD